MSRGLTLGLAALLLVVLGVCLERFVLSDAAAAPPTYLERLRAELSLTDEQVSSIAELLADEDAAIEALRRTRIEELRAPVAEVRADTEDRLLELLDESQRARYREL